MKGRPIVYSPAERAWLQANATLVIGEYHRQFCQVFGRDPGRANLNSFRKRNGWRTGRTGHFAKGAAPANKGKPMPFNANSAATRFRKGQLPHNTKYAGHERITQDGYVEISIEQTNPHTGFERRYVLKHRWLWEQANGPVPEGMALKCLGDRLNTDPANWELVPRALLPRLNGRFGRGYDQAPAELKPLIMTVAKIEHRLRQRGDDTDAP